MNAVSKQATKELKSLFLTRVANTISKSLEECTKQDLYLALAYAVRDFSSVNWVKTQEAYRKTQAKKVYYISLEFLMGRTLGNNLINCGIYEEAKEMLASIDVELEDVIDEESDAGLGNGGLGRLAACFLDSMATLDLPAFGSGIRYDYGIFEQKIENGFQVEEPDNWLRDGNAWEVCRPDRKVRIRFHGKSSTYRDKEGKLWHQWIDTEDVLAMPYDTPITGYETDTVNTLRLWSAKSLFGFNLDEFNRGDYINANINKSISENISKVLYPNDNNYEGKELRLKQQYFLAASTIADIIADCKDEGIDLRKMSDYVAIQLNDTHPAIAIPELMRVLMDEEGFTWDESWAVCTQTFAYTNHTLLAEALEKWPLPLMQDLLPRHMEIIFEINYHFMRAVANFFPGDNAKLRDMSIIQEDGEKYVRMAYLSIVGSHSVNGVAALHTELLKNGLVKDFFEFSPEKFNNKTNGITPRRWMKMCNPEMSKLITSKIGPEWPKDLDELVKFEKFKSDAKVQKEWLSIKQANKAALVDYVHNKLELDVELDPSSMFSIQIKRIHEYKRQFMNILRVIAQYNEIKENPKKQFTNTTVLFAGKAAPGYYLAKQTIKLINAVSAVVNVDPDCQGKLKVLFLPNYSVSMAEKLIPAADLSEQISTAGKEASGTGNMKFALNGALTVGTLDGANVEMKDCVGDDNIYIFGLTVEEVEEMKANGYNPHAFMPEGSRLKKVLDLIESGFFCPENPGLFSDLVATVKYHGDHYMVAADFDAYYSIHEDIAKDFKDKKKWTKEAIVNVANMGKFSSDRTIKQYAEEIWGVKSQK